MTKGASSLYNDEMNKNNPVSGYYYRADIVVLE
jgi:hypothetical protein